MREMELTPEIIALLKESFYEGYTIGHDDGTHRAFNEEEYIVGVKEGWKSHLKQIFEDEMEYKKYSRTNVAEMTDWVHGMDIEGVSISEPDLENGSPKPGDKIARNPDNHADKWLVSKEYFDRNFEPL